MPMPRHLKRFRDELRRDWLRIKRTTLEDVGYLLLGTILFVLLAGLMR